MSSVFHYVQPGRRILSIYFNLYIFKTTEAVVHEPAVEQYPPTHQGASQTLHGSTDNEPSLDIDQSPVK